MKIIEKILIFILVALTVYGFLASIVNNLDPAYRDIFPESTR